jgi:polyribonucleotide nucleotidyltransferase
MTLKMDKRKIITEKFEVGGKEIVLEVGKLAPQATAAVAARCGGTVVLATVVMGEVRKDIDYFPLFVEYVERLYAGGRIKGSRWVKREGKPSDEAVLAGRMIDRSIRPLFPKELKSEVQVAVTVMSIDGENHPDTLAGVATSAALAISPIPWEGPVGMVRVAVKEGKCLVNPSNGETEGWDLEVVVSSTGEKVLMLEAGGKQVKEQEVLNAIVAGHKENQMVVEAVGRLVKQVGGEKLVVSGVEVDEKVKRVASEVVGELVKEFLESVKGGTSEEKIGRGIDFGQALELVKERAGEGVDELTLKGLIEKEWKKAFRKLTLGGKRIDGRGYEEVRGVSGEVAVLPRTHGTGFFQRGMTHVLAVATLGTPSLEQWIETAEGEEQKRYIHHYSMPPYSTGETGRFGFPKRREIGHGALAEKALEPVLPTEEEFPYTIRVVSEVMSSNGSTSMGSACASTLALMDAGVPIKSPVAGIAMGLVEEGGKAEVLTDIAGIEDFNGDMDFKVAGTKEGVTAVQLDVKNRGLDLELVEEVLKRALEARLKILEGMLKALPESRKEISQFAPTVEVVEIPVEKIGEVIGPGGKMIRKIIAETGASVDVEDDGKVTISAVGVGLVKKAAQWVKDLVREVEVGEIFEGEVKRIVPFGAFVEILPGKEGLVHVSRMATSYVGDPNDVVSMGEKVQVRVSEIDELGRTNLSMILDPELEKEAMARQSGPRGGQHAPQVPQRRGGQGQSRSGGYQGGGGQSRYAGKFPKVSGGGRGPRRGFSGGGRGRSPQGGSRGPSRGGQGSPGGGFSTHRRPGRGQRSAPSDRRHGR